MIRISIPLSPKTEQDIIDRLDEVKSKSGYIKSLIRADIERNKGQAIACPFPILYNKDIEI